VVYPELVTCVGGISMSPAKKPLPSSPERSFARPSGVSRRTTKLIVSALQEGERTRPSVYTLNIGGTRPTVTSGYTKMRATSVPSTAAGGVALGDGAGAEGARLGEGDGAATVAGGIETLASPSDPVGVPDESAVTQADTSAATTPIARSTRIRRADGPCPVRAAFCCRTETIGPTP
jgi:hypothetical protein